jgi:hypothetical protein
MFSDRLRKTKILLLGSLLATLCLCNFFTGPRRLQADIEERIRHAAEQVEPAKFGFARVLEVREDGTVRMLVWGRERAVSGIGVEVRPGDIVSFTGLYTPQGGIEAQTVTVHKLRRTKKIVSLAAVLILAAVSMRRVSRRILRRKEACRT